MTDHFIVTPGDVGRTAWWVGDHAGRPVLRSGTIESVSARRGTWIRMGHALVNVPERMVRLSELAARSELARREGIS